MEQRGRFCQSDACGKLGKNTSLCLGHGYGGQHGLAQGRRALGVSFANCSLGLHVLRLAPASALVSRSAYILYSCLLVHQTRQIHSIISYQWKKRNGMKKIFLDYEQHKRTTKISLKRSTGTTCNLVWTILIVGSLPICRNNENIM